MRKALKQNDGYVLPYVLVVFLVLSFVAVTICSLSLDNLRAQEASIKQAQATYEAEGEIEKVLAQLQSLTVTGPTVVSGQADANAAAAAAFWNEAKDRLSITLEDGADTGAGVNDLTIKAVPSDRTVTVTAQLQLTLQLDAVDIGIPETYQTVASVATGGVLYKAYDISHSAPEGGGGA